MQTFALGLPTDLCGVLTPTSAQLPDGGRRQMHNVRVPFFCHIISALGQVEISTFTDISSSNIVKYAFS